MIERFEYTSCRMEVSVVGRCTKAYGDELAFDSRNGSGSGMAYRFRVWLPAPFHAIGVVEFVLDTVDPRAVQLAIDRETAAIRSYANHRLAQLAEELADGERPEGR